MAWEFVTIARANPHVWLWPSAAVDPGLLARLIGGAVFEVGSAHDAVELHHAFPGLAAGASGANGPGRSDGAGCLKASRPDWHPALVSAAVLEALADSGWEIVYSSLVGGREETRMGRRTVS